MGTNHAVLLRGILQEAAPVEGEYNGKRIRTRLEVLRDVLLRAAECRVWLTLAEMSRLTGIAEVSCSTYVVALRRPEYGGYEVLKRRREQPAPRAPGADGRLHPVWEYGIRVHSVGRVEQADDQPGQQ